MSQRKEGTRLKGLDALLGYLETTKTAFASSDVLRRVAFLIDRAREDFEVAADAALGGMHAVVFDAMRDVMEIQFLLRDFRLTPPNLEEWVSAPESVRRRKYKPVDLRQRYATHVGRERRDLAEEADYSAHSASLHVSPRPSFSPRGIVEGHTDEFITDACYWEIFEHAKRLIEEICAIGSPTAGDAWPLPSFEQTPEPIRNAWERTREMQALYLAMQQATIDE